MAATLVRLSAHFLLDEREEARREAAARLRNRRSRVSAMTDEEWRRYTADPAAPDVLGRWQAIPKG